MWMGLLSARPQRLGSLWPLPAGLPRSLSVVVWSREVVLGVVRIHIGQAGQGQTTKALESQAAPHATGIREPVPVPEEQSNLMSTFA